MTRQPLVLTIAALLTGCATLVHGPYQDVRIDSNPPGATATIAAQMSERGPGYLDAQKRTITTPATVRLSRDNSYRIEFEKAGYKGAQTQVVSEYDWFWPPVNIFEFVGALPSADVKDSNLGVRFAETTFYELPKGALGAFGRAVRVFIPDALLGNSFKLKEKDSGFWSDWHALETPAITAQLQPGS